MTTTNPVPETTQSFTGPQPATVEMRDAEPESVQAEAEEEEFLELWAADRGNQAA